MAHQRAAVLPRGPVQVTGLWEVPERPSPGVRDWIAPPTGRAFSPDTAHRR